MRLSAGIVVTLLSVHAFAASWSCGNDLEIHCDMQKCEVSDSFTPLDVRIQSDGTLSVCAYSGCWEGKGRVLKSGAAIFVSGRKLRWSGEPHGVADFGVMVDPSDNVGFVKGAGFAVPVHCIRQAP